MVKKVHELSPISTGPKGRPNIRLVHDTVNDLKVTKVDNWTGYIFIDFKVMF